MTVTRDNEAKEDLAPGNVDADRPCLSLKDDKLGREPVVRGLLAQIINRPALDTMVFSVEGPWGSGKSSFLNFVETELQKQEKIRVLRFEPWWFSSADDLIVRFFQGLQGSLGRIDDRKLGLIAEKAGEIAKLAKPATALVPGLKEAVELIVEATGTITNAAKEKQKDVRYLRNEMESLLKDADTQIVVLIDDLDRLQYKEISEVFRMLKGISALKRMVYIVAFDTAVVENALEAQGGAVYLEKIIQCSIHLPPPSLDQLRKELSEALAPFTPDKAVAERWREFYNEAFIDRLITIRDIKRLANVCHSLFPIVAEEVDPADFIAIQGLRLFYPQVYAQLSSYVMGAGRRNLKPTMTIKPPQEFLKEVVHPSTWARLESFINLLFSPLPPAPLLGPSRNLTTYIRLAPEEGTVSNKRWKTLLQDLKHGPHQLIESLGVNVASRRYVDSVLVRLEALLTPGGGVSEQICTNVIEALLTSSDAILMSDRPSMRQRPVFWALNRIVLLAMNHLPRNGGVRKFKEALKRSTQVVICARICLTLDTESLDELCSTFLISEVKRELPSLKRIVVRKIKERAKSGELWEYERDFTFLHAIWREWASPGAGISWLRSLLKAQPSLLIELVNRCHDESQRQGFNSWTTSKIKEFNAPQLKKLESMVRLKRETLKKRTRVLLGKDSVSDEDREMLNALMDAIADADGNS